MIAAGADTNISLIIAVIKGAQPERLPPFFSDMLTANWISAEQVFQRRT